MRVDYIEVEIPKAKNGSDKHIKGEMKKPKNIAINNIKTQPIQYTGNINNYLKLIRKYNIIEIYLAMHHNMTDIDFNPDNTAVKAALKDINSNISFVYNSICPECISMANRLQPVVIGTKKGLTRWYSGDKFKAEKNFCKYIVGSKQHYILDYIVQDLPNRVDMLQYIQ